VVTVPAKLFRAISALAAGLLELTARDARLVKAERSNYDFSRSAG